MRRPRGSWILVSLLLAGLTATPSLQAQFACKQELMAGAWTTHAKLDMVGGQLPAAGPFAEVGLLVFDQTGLATTAIQTNVAAAGVFPTDYIEGDPAVGPLDVRFTVNQDCTGSWTFRERSTGAPLFEFATVCADGQRKCFATFTGTLGSTAQPEFIGVVTLTKVDSPESDLDAKLDAVAAKIDLILHRLGY